MQDFGNASELKLKYHQLKTILFTYRLLYQERIVTTNQKSAIETHKKRKRNPSTTLKLVTKSQEKRTKEERKKKDLQNKSKQLTKYKNIYINNQIKREWIKCFNRDTD